MEHHEMQEAEPTLQEKYEILYNKYEGLREIANKRVISHRRYLALRDMGVVITIEGEGAVYLQGEEMDKWFEDKLLQEPLSATAPY